MCWSMVASSNPATARWRTNWKRTATAGSPNAVLPKPGPERMTTPLQQTLATQPLPPIDTAAQPAWFAERRQQAVLALAAAPWPQRKDEAWRYTSLHELVQLAPQPAPAQLPATVDDAALAFVAGQGVD